MRSADTISTDARDQIARLREQVENLMRDRVPSGFSDAADRAQDAAQRASDAARQQAEALSDRVRDQPLIAIIAAFGVGYLLGRFIR